MKDVNKNLEDALYEATKGFVNVIIKKLEEQISKTQVPMKETNEKVMSAKDVCVYYGFSLSTLNRHEQKGLKRMKSAKHVNRMFKFSVCEKYFNQKIN